jgi:hypothetical protein
MLRSIFMVRYAALTHSTFMVRYTALNFYGALRCANTPYVCGALCFARFLWYVTLRQHTLHLLKSKI